MPGCVWMVISPCGSSSLLIPFPGRYQGDAAPSPPREAGLQGACFTLRAVCKGILARSGEMPRLWEPVPWTLHQEEA